MSDVEASTPPQPASVDSIDAQQPEMSSEGSWNVNKKYLKLGVAGLAVTALVTGLSVGLTSKNKASNNNLSASAANSASGVYGDIDEEECVSVFWGGKSGKGGKGSKSGSGSGKTGKSRYGKSSNLNEVLDHYDYEEEEEESEDSLRLARGESLGITWCEVRTCYVSHHVL